LRGSFAKIAAHQPGIVGGDRDLARGRPAGPAGRWSSSSAMSRPGWTKPEWCRAWRGSAGRAGEIGGNLGHPQRLVQRGAGDGLPLRRAGASGSASPAESPWRSAGRAGKGARSIWRKTPGRRRRWWHLSGPAGRAGRWAACRGRGSGRSRQGSRGRSARCQAYRSSSSPRHAAGGQRMSAPPSPDASPRGRGWRGGRERPPSGRPEVPEVKMT
jgi:hypothetical protein